MIVTWPGTARGAPRIRPDTRLNCRGTAPMSEPATASVLFVCMGNICRSPTAEGVFRALVERERLSGRIRIESAGTHDSQLGAPPDTRAVRVAKLRGYDLSAQRARRFEVEDFGRFEWIIAMDGHNLRFLKSLRPSDHSGHMGLFLDFAPELGLRDIPDPYYGRQEDFVRVLDLVERCAAPLLDAIRREIEKGGAE
jgi:protein-tyrosine phosphatase